MLAAGLVLGQWEPRLLKGEVRTSELGESSAVWSREMRLMPLAPHQSLFRKLTSVRREKPSHE